MSTHFLSVGLHCQFAGRCEWLSQDNISILFTEALSLTFEYASLKLFEILFPRSEKYFTSGIRPAWAVVGGFWFWALTTSPTPTGPLSSKSPVVSFEAEYVLLHHRVEIALPALNQEYLEIGWNSVCYLLQTPRNSTRISKQHYSWDARTSHPHYSHWSQRVTHSCADTPPWRKINLSSDSTTPTLWYRIYAFLRVKVSLCIFELWSEKCGHWNEAHCVWLFSFLLRTRFQ